LKNIFIFISRVRGDECNESPKQRATRERTGCPVEMRSFTIPPKTSRLAPCADRGCGHPSCDQLRTIAASPCTLCRRVIGYGVIILDERTELQRENGVEHVGFTHYDCRRRWKLRYHPQPRKPSKRTRLPTPTYPTAIHLDDEPIQ
jgi:hypothetical protein